MFVVTVDFIVKKAFAEEFSKAIMIQAGNSLQRESGCHRFDVCVDHEDPCRIFLYEMYSSEAAFQVHLNTDHYRAYDNRVKPWVENKTVKTWKSVEIDPASEDFVPIS